MSVYQGLKFFYYRLFLFEILFLQCILFFIVLGTFALIVGIETLEILFDIGKGVFHLACLTPQFAKQLVECRLDGLCFLAAQHAVRRFHQAFEYIRQLRQRLVGKGSSLFFLNFGFDVFFAHN